MSGVTGEEIQSPNGYSDKQVGGFRIGEVLIDLNCVLVRGIFHAVLSASGSFTSEWKCQVETGKGRECLLDNHILCRNSFRFDRVQGSNKMGGRCT
jgi:hypothetical protein